MSEEDKPKDDHIKVIVRSRPLNEEEKAARTPSLVLCDSEARAVKVATNIGGKRGSKVYNFDMVFGQYATQAEIYEAAIEPIVEEVLQGYNCTVFAYGQTGTGKTHTMEGVIDDPELHGVIPRAVDSIFATLSTRDDAEYSAKCSFLELYNEELQDLLSVTDEKKLRLVDDKSKLSSGVTCHNLEEVMVSNTEDLLSIMRNALAKRQVAATNLNKTSSRSHCIFTFTIHIKETTPEGEDLLKVGKLNLVDLAGSESIGRSGAKDKRAREAGNINKSLLTLGRVITALVERTPHVPYRDSKLTRLLQESLGGRAKTCIIATVAPSVQCLDETLSTLEYASRAKSIKNKPEANQRMTKRALMKEYVEDIQRLRQELACARAKEGVYMPEEQYNTMVTTNESQKQQLEELEALLESRAKEFAEIKELFNSTKENLEKTEQSLNTTKTKLNSTQLELGSTKLELHCEKEKVKERNVVIQEHQKTEQKLVHGTKSLQSTIDSATSDVEKLHSKLDRKKAVEEHNIQVGKKFSDETVDALTKMGALSTEFSNSQVATLQSISSQVNAMVETGNAGIAKVLQLVSTSHGDFSNSLTEFSNDANALGSNLKREIAEKVASHTIAKEKEHAESATAMETSMQENMRKIIDELLVEHRSVQEKQVEAIQRQIAEQRANLESFVAAQQSCLEQIENLLAVSNGTQRKMIETQNARMEEFVNEEVARNEQAMETFTQQFQELLSSFAGSQHSAMKSFIDASKQTNIELTESLRESRTKSAELLRCTGNECGSWKSIASDGLAKIGELCSEEASELNTICGNIKTTAETANAKLAEDVGNLGATVRSMKDDVVSSMNTMETVLMNHSQTMDEKHALAQESVKSQYESISRSVQELESRSSSACKESVSLCNQTEAEVQDFTREMNSRIEDIARSCDDLVNSALKIDQPTGATPVRKEYPYTPTIPTTSPEERIIERYRESKIPKSRDAIEKTPLRTRSASTPYDKDKLPVKKTEEEQTEQDENAPPLATEEFSQALKRLSQDGTPLRERNNRDNETENTSFLEKVLNKSDEGQVDVDQILSKETIMKMKVTELRRELSARSCPQFGNKAILQTRLLEWMDANQSEPAREEVEESL